MSYRGRIRSIKREIFIRDNYICRYCSFPAEVMDHVIAKHHCGPTAEWNLVACCTRCNQIASSWYFETFEEKREFILKKRRKEILNGMSS